ncbi:hypothetical protein NDU88_000388 [Pleurodeles waltl]|uniref:Hexosyltransferase n=1 Tax=Pleurodeles waltl TaxID=8319 RepID=A0AAV7KNA2_PLEWA|nr:hypothetical protein NDU88_000388 [Pleurodeles waltl]
MATRQTWAAEREVSGYHVKTLFLMAKTENASHMQLVAREIKEYHDILQWDFVESHHNLSLKERCFLEWVHYNCKEVEFIFKGDDDEFVNPEAVVKYVKETPEAAHTIHGNMQTKSVVMHTGKYRVSKSLFPYCLYPIFPSGGGFILPGAFIPALYQVSTWLPVFPLDDVYFGFLALAANLSLRHDERFDTLGTLNGICSYKKALVIHGNDNLTVDDNVRMERENVKANSRKTYFDHKHSVKVTKVNVGDWVMIKRPGFQSGGNKLSKPMKFVKIFNNAIRTDDHRVWNLNRVVPYKGKEIQDVDENDQSRKNRTFLLVGP